MLRAKMLRQSISRYGVDILLQQSYTITMEFKVDDDDCDYLISTCLVPTPIRKSSTSSPFLFVGIQGKIPYTFIREYEVYSIPTIPINSLNKYYTLDNGRLKTYNSTAKQLKLIDVFEDAEQLDINCDGQCEDDDMYLPMPADFADTIIKDLVQELGATVDKPNDETIVEN